VRSKSAKPRSPVRPASRDRPARAPPPDRCRAGSTCQPRYDARSSKPAGLTSGHDPPQQDRRPTPHPRTVDDKK
jgi:hypothetical protein